MIALLVAVGLSLQDPDELGRLAAALGADAVEERDRARARLLEVGEPALPALRPLAEAADAELRLRARFLIETIERRAAERRHDEAQRRVVFREGPPAPTGEEVRHSVRTEGALFVFGRKPFGGHAVAYTGRRAIKDIRVEFRVAKAADPAGRDVEVEACGRCSPGMVLVKTAGPFRLRLQGVRTWFSPYEIVFESPKLGDFRKVGDATIRVAWPDLAVRSERGWPPAVLSSIGDEFRFELLPGRERVETLDFVSDKPFRGIGSTEPPAGWCYCVKGPSPVRPPPPRETELRVVGGGEGTPLEDVARIRYTFRKPVEEPFEVESPDLLPK
jgi:hypothetical protein